VPPSVCKDQKVSVVASRTLAADRSQRSVLRVWINTSKVGVREETWKLVFSVSSTFASPPPTPKKGLLFILLIFLMRGIWSQPQPWACPHLLAAPRDVLTAQQLSADCLRSSFTSVSVLFLFVSGFFFLFSVDPALNSNCYKQSNYNFNSIYKSVFR
jgi:hypothetical protein